MDIYPLSGVSVKVNLDCRWVDWVLSRGLVEAAVQGLVLRPGSDGQELEPFFKNGSKSWVCYSTRGLSKLHLQKVTLRFCLPLVRERFGHGGFGRFVRVGDEILALPDAGGLIVFTSKVDQSDQSTGN